MKKLPLLLACLLLLASCAGGTINSADPTASSATDGVSETAAAATATETAEMIPDTDLSDAPADVDMTKMDEQMAYVQLSNMMTSPEDYTGKTVKMRGTFAHAAEGDKEFFVCYLMDATACCSQSIEFETDETYPFPQSYPPVESGITVYGTFDTYQYNGFRMYRLLHAEVDYEG